MGLTEYPDVAQRSAEWHELRCGMLTASAVGRLLTPTLKVADNDTSRGLIAALVAKRITGQAEDGFVNADMWRGIEHEPFARAKYAQHHAPVVECGFMVRDDDGWQLGYSPDGLVGDDGLIEVKCPRAKGHLQTILADEVPEQHMAQLQAGLLVSGRDWVDFVSFFAGLPLFVKRVEPDLRWFTAIAAAVESFETKAAEMVAVYQQLTADMPATERVELEVVI